MPLLTYWAHKYLHFQRLPEFVTSYSKQTQNELLQYYIFYPSGYLTILPFQIKKSKQCLAACLGRMLIFISFPDIINE
jgi:hypothetical protein